MLEGTNCWTASTAINAVALIITLIFAVDALLRKVPNLVAKARVSFVAVTIFRFTADIYTEQPQIENHIQIQGSFQVLRVVLIPAILYFFENFALFMSNADTVRDFKTSKTIQKFLRMFPAVRVFCVVYAITLCVVYQFSPTNAVFAASRICVLIGWLPGLALSVFIGRLGLLIRRHKLNIQRVRHEHHLKNSCLSVVFVSILHIRSN